MLVEVSADKCIPDEVIGLVPSLDGSSEKEVVIRAEYNWKPSRCCHCNIFGHSFGVCNARPLSDDEKIAKLKKEELSKSNKMNDEGFQVVGKKNRPVQNRNINGNGVSQQAGNKAWVNQKFGVQNQNVGQGNGRQNQSGLKFRGDDGKHGQQSGIGKSWQVKHAAVGTGELIFSNLDQIH